MSLGDVWFGLFVVIIAGYLILDGFDMGVGILHPWVAKTDEERRLTLNSIGPIWDGNEVWIVLGGGVLFAAFAPVYASLFSGFYLALMLVLLVMILRTVSIEFRSKRPSQRWRQIWDWVFSISSLGLALLLGVAFGNIIAGVDLEQNGTVSESLIDLLNPYALLVGVTAVSMFALHGAHFLDLKTEGELERRVRRAIPLLMGVFFILTTATVISTAIWQDEVSDRFLDEIWPVIFPAAALGAFVASWWLYRTGRDFWAFVASAGTIALLIISGAVGMFPNLLISSINDSYNLTVDNSASAPSTLTVMLVVALIGMPLVLVYTAGIYYFFRGKTALGPDSY
jgi:cytochrome bd ubiquinol oxidase subunit II